MIFVTDFRMQYGIKFAMRMKLVLEASSVINITVIDSSKSTAGDDNPASVVAKATLKHVIESQKPQGKGLF